MNTMTPVRKRKKVKKDERRTGERRNENIEALLGGKKFVRHRCENAVIEDIGGGGIRIRSGAELAENDTVVLYDDGGSALYYARVIWSIQEGLITKRSTGRAGKATIAGCKLYAGNQKIKARKQKKLIGETSSVVTKALTRLFLIGGIVALLGVIYYWLSTLMSMW